MAARLDDWYNIWYNIQIFQINTGDTLSFLYSYMRNASSNPDLLS